MVYTLVLMVSLLGFFVIIPQNLFLLAYYVFNFFRFVGICGSVHSVFSRLPLTPRIRIYFHLSEEKEICFRWYFCSWTKTKN